MWRLCSIIVLAFLLIGPAAWTVDDANGPPSPLLSVNPAPAQPDRSGHHRQRSAHIRCDLQTRETAAVSDQQGNFRLTLGPADYKLQVSAQGYSRDVGLLLD
jgi:hypothetical protein